MTTRRQFLKRSATGGTAVALLPIAAGIQLAAMGTAQRRLDCWLRSFGAASPARRVVSACGEGPPVFAVRFGGHGQRQRAHEALYDHFDRAIIRLGNILELHSGGDCVVVKLVGDDRSRT